MAPNNWFPTLTGQVPGDVDYAIRRLYENQYALRDQLPTTTTSASGNNIASSNPSAGVGGAGIFGDSSPTLGQRPTNLSVGNAGYLYQSTYFNRLWMWTGSGWVYADGALGAGAIVATGGSVAPSGGLWQPCNGATVSIALSNATLGTATASVPSPLLGLVWWMRR